MPKGRSIEKSHTENTIINMRNFAITILLCLVTTISVGQKTPNEYYALVKVADSLSLIKDYKNSAAKYSEAFKANRGRGTEMDRYNAACAYALFNVPDSAFYQLNYIVTKAKYGYYDHISVDVDLISLHKDKRWQPLLQKVKQNKDIAEAKFNKPLIEKLGVILNDDQKYRQQIEEIESKFGSKSVEMKTHWKVIKEQDSINLIKVEEILSKNGWLGRDVVGDQGNETLFLVIQHSDQKTQEKYLPMLRDAVKQGNADGYNLAMLEDRVALKQGKRQIYGSQIGRDEESLLYFVSPLEDPDNVDQRRAEVGLRSLKEYVAYWQITWDVEQYKKDLPKLEEKIKSR